MVDWTQLGIIAEAIAYAFSVLGVAGLGWYLATTILEKLGNMHKSGNKTADKPT
jgi:hypothetical protein